MVHFTGPDLDVPHGQFGAVTLPGEGHAIPASVTTGLINAQRTAPKNAVIVMLHGLSGAPGQMAPAALALNHDGYEVVIPWLAGSARSTIHQRGFGPIESQEALAVARWARAQRPGCKVILVGSSMGAAACWLAAETDASLVDGVVSESGFCRLAEFAPRYLGRHIPGGVNLLPFVPPLAAQMLNVDPAQVNPIEGASSFLGKPCVVIHDTADTLMFEDEATQLAQAAQCQVERFEGAEHAGAPAKDLTRYVRVIESVAERATAPPAGQKPHPG